jgi:hypothetical protein
MAVDYLPEGENCNDLHIAHYNDHGNWARHYSVVRMTVGTFFVTSSFTILGLQWNHPDRGLALLIYLYFLTGACIFLFFTRLTFKKFEDQRKLAEQAREAIGTHDRIPRKGFLRIGRWLEEHGSGWPLALILVLLFSALDYFWIHREMVPDNPIRLGRLTYFENFSSGGIEVADLDAERKLQSVCNVWSDRHKSGETGWLFIVGAADQQSMNKEAIRQYESNFGLAQARAEGVKARIISRCQSAPVEERLIPEQIVTLATGPPKIPIPGAALTPGEAKDRRVDIWAMWFRQ